MWEARGLLPGLFNQPHLGAGHELFVVEKNSMRSPIEPMASRWSLLMVVENSGTGCSCSGVKVITSDTPSTTMPTTCFLI